MVETYYIKGVQKQLFADDLQNRCPYKFCKVDLCCSHVAHVLSYDVSRIFKNTYFLITPQNQTMLLRKQISKIT